MSGRRSTSRLTVGERRAIGAGLIGLLVVAAAVQVGRADSQAAQAREQVQVLAARPTPTVTAQPLPAATVVVTPDPTDAALAVKPLRDLVEGDRVVYTPEPGGPGVVCRWVRWGGEIAVSVIACGDEPEFQTPTGYLTPVETR